MEELSLRMMHLSLMKGIAPAYFDAALGVADESVGSATRSAKRFKRPGHPSPHVRPSRMLSPPSAKAIKASRPVMGRLMECRPPT